jgi:predicted phosphohydrolase
LAIYAISDLHLALSVDKPMDIFGYKWANYMQRLESNWNEIIGPEDYVVIPGDISWATYLEEALEDFKFIDALPGNKIISKGNHDYWWTSHSKLRRFVEENKLSSLHFMHNNSVRVGKITICGTRGWICPGDDGFGTEDRKIYNRELQRLELSLKSVQPDTDAIIAALHYPPFNSKKEPTEFVEIMRKYCVKLCLYGHLHGDSFKNAVMQKVDGIDFKLVSADYLEFTPIRLEN